MPVLQTSHPPGTPGRKASGFGLCHLRLLKFLLGKPSVRVREEMLPPVVQYKLLDGQLKSVTVQESSKTTR